jgi:hypothetical protein
MHCAAPGSAEQNRSPANANHVNRAHGTPPMSLHRWQAAFHLAGVVELRSSKMVKPADAEIADR